jgi:hypothetical protein
LPFVKKILQVNSNVSLAGSFFMPNTKDLYLFDSKKFFHSWKRIPLPRYVRILNSG